MKYTEETFHDWCAEGVIDALMKMISEGFPLRVSCAKSDTASELKDIANYSFDPLAESCELRETCGRVDEDHVSFVRRMGKEFEAWRAYKLLAKMKKRGVTTITKFKRSSVMLDCENITFHFEMQRDSDSMPHLAIFSSPSANIKLCKEKFNL